ncbi:ATP-grasp domain-containing protein [Sphingomonas sp. BT-65]|uniref:ATP-grasp domain-containing protein n=1 Tax=Sphingomonas sp. BT-65 TaxID=2989821 RepID=UPI0022357C43|nr:ATP-grasp domain-containing protein [Sphingomonas sp. BT-65]MCW4463449.1 ATP-grasp domain-containing protein [Sphingomonas sp. BT-65]
MHQLIRDQALEIPPITGHDRQLTMLLCSAGRRVGLLRAFRRAAANLHVDLRIIACDVQPEWSAACRLSDLAVRVPYADDPDYIPAIEAICREYNVGLVVPTIDPELLPLAEARERLAAVGTTVAVGDRRVIEICRDKLRTATFLAEHGIPVPRTIDLALADRRDWNGPAIVKPRSGSAGRAITRVDDLGALTGIAPEPMVVQELLEGEEWTVNIYFDRAGALRSVVPHRRVQVRAGEVEKGVTGRQDQLMEIAGQMAACLPGPYGALCYQAIIAADGSAKVFEINARFGGGYPLADYAGANFAQWLIEERLALPSTAANEWTAGVAMLRFDAAIFVRL